MKMVNGGSHGIVQGLNKGNLMSSNLLHGCLVKKKEKSNPDYG